MLPKPDHPRRTNPPLGTDGTAAAAGANPGAVPHSSPTSPTHGARCPSHRAAADGRGQPMGRGQPELSFQETPPGLPAQRDRPETQSKSQLELSVRRRGSPNPGRV